LTDRNSLFNTEWRKNVS